jgi:hypothetical protein
LISLALNWSQFKCTEGQHIHKNISAIYYMDYIDMGYIDIDYIDMDYIDMDYSTF